MSDKPIWSSRGEHDFGAVRRSHVAPEKRDGGQHEDYTLHHPAFGMVTVTQWHSGGDGARLFGSDLTHHTGITLHFNAAHAVRGLSSDRHSHDETLLEVNMSMSQWARLVSSIGNGNGVPVTVTMRRDGKLRPCPQIAAPEASKKEIHGEEMATALRKRLEAMSKRVAQLGDMIASGKVTKPDLRAIHEELARHCEQLPGTVQFIHERFAEATEHVADDAKTEVEAFVDGVVRRLGVQSLHDLLPLITDESRRENEQRAATAEQEEAEAGIAASWRLNWPNHLR